jgi:hypothetical protein
LITYPNNSTGHAAQKGRVMNTEEQIYYAFEPKRNTNGEGTKHPQNVDKYNNNGSLTR